MTDRRTHPTDSTDSVRRVRADELEAISPQDAVEMYLSERSTDVSDSTLYAHKSRLGHFTRWCELQDVQDLTSLTPRDLYRYKVWRADDGNLNRVSIKTQLSTLRVFIAFCEQIGAVTAGLSETIDIPTLDQEEQARSAHIKPERAKRILRHLDQYHYARFKHALLFLLWRTGMRIGALRALDLSDCDLEAANASVPNITITHRPETDTPLKNKTGGERQVALADDIAQVLRDWCTVHRPTVTDAYGRTPVFCTQQGRASKNHIRRECYKLTCPTFIGEDCSCDTAEHDHQGYAACADTLSPHDIRRSAITHELRQETPKEIVSERMDVSRDVLDTHYNELTDEEKMSVRADRMDRFSS